MTKEITTQTKEVTVAERFVGRLLTELGAGQEVDLTPSQKRLAQGYFTAMDVALQEAEKRRNNQYNKLPYTWESIDMNKLARSVTKYAKLGLDPLQKNHIFPIPYADGKSGKYVMTFIEGYRGLELVAKKYALDPPKSITIELVHKNDNFRMIKKGKGQSYDTYTFDIDNPFDRGDIVGGFYYFEYDDERKNKLVVVPLSEVLKRKPDKASADFWGGEKDVYKNGTKAGKEQVDGWYDKMVYKTIARMAFSDITIDPSKVDADYMDYQNEGVEAKELKTQEVIDQNQNSQRVDITEHVKVHDAETGEIVDDSEDF